MTDGLATQKQNTQDETERYVRACQGSCHNLPYYCTHQYTVRSREMHRSGTRYNILDKLAEILAQRNGNSLPGAHQAGFRVRDRPQKRTRKEEGDILSVLLREEKATLAWSTDTLSARSGTASAHHHVGREARTAVETSVRAYTRVSSGMAVLRTVQQQCSTARGALGASTAVPHRSRITRRPPPPTLPAGPVPLSH